jgi:hypothetical protein
LIAVGLLLARSLTLREAWDTTTVVIFGRAVLGTTGIFGLGLFA